MRGFDDRDDDTTRLRPLCSAGTPAGLVLRRVGCPPRGVPGQFQPPAWRFLLVTRYEDVFDVLTDTETFTSTASAAIPPQPFMFIPEDVDPPKHRKYRKITNHALSPQRMEDYEPWVRQCAIDFLEPLVGQSEFDLVKCSPGHFPVALR